MDYMVSRREQLYGSIFTILLSFALFYYSHTENREITDIELTSITGTL